MGWRNIMLTAECLDSREVESTDSLADSSLLQGVGKVGR